MSALGLPDFVGKPLGVLLIDLLLAGDNAMVIALICRSLSPRRLPTALALGTLGAVLARLFLVAFAGGVLTVPGLKLAGGALLAVLALNLACPDPRRGVAPLPRPGQSGVLATALVVALVDVLLSFDNVLALAAVAGDSLLYLGIGLGLSVAVLMFGSALVSGLLRQYPGLVRLGTVLLGWVAGQMAVSDPLLQSWIAQQSPALPLIVPALAAGYVFLVSRPAPFVAQPTSILSSVRPPRRPVPAPAPPAPLVRPSPEAPQTPRSNRVELVMFAMLFIVGGLILGLMALLGTGAKP